jgi:glycosyltransferase involved in cell wall biosynthesis
MSSLASALAENPSLRLTVVTAMAGVTGRCTDEQGVEHVILPLRSRRSIVDQPSASLRAAFQRIVSETAPELIHVHGSEFLYGLLQEGSPVPRPQVVSIQGILDGYWPFCGGGLSVPDMLRFRTLRDWIRFDGMLEQSWRMRQRAEQVEARALAAARHVIGRTDWDREHMRRLAPRAVYHHGDEALREAFHAAPAWTIAGVRRHSVYASAASIPLKGFHHLLEAASMLKGDFPGLRIRVALPVFATPGSLGARLRETGYAPYLRNRIRALGLREIVDPLGELDEAGVAAELGSAHAFVLPSLIENSPNSLAEAMVVGTPSVVSCVGGVPSMARDGESALFFGAGDPTHLALQLRRLFTDDALAMRLSGEARRVARPRHDPATVARQIVGIYEDILRWETGRVSKTCGSHPA